MKGYKVFSPDWTCRGFQYEVGKTYKHDGDIIMCKSGFHFCEKAVDCFNYYSFDHENKVAEVRAVGKTIKHDDDSKVVAKSIKILREISWQELLTIVNTGANNTGRSNSGHSNSGHRNSGHSNSGDRNSGDRNSGHGNSGDSNSGHSNSGHSNSGDRNSGDRNSGHGNSGDSNSGHSNSGHRNSGHSNSGDRNSGHRNSGHSNSGHRNSGHSNSGHSNSGHRNSGHSNSGDWNSGDWNSCNHQAGVFNTEEKKIYMFNKRSGWTYRKWLESDAREILLNMNLAEWVSWGNMTKSEQKENPQYELQGGYLRHYEYKEACKIMWSNLTDEEKKTVMALPNFDPAIFEEITGIKV